MCSMLLAALLSLQAPSSSEGAIVAVGGGSMGQEIVKKIMDLAGPDPSVVVLPQASSRSDAGARSVGLWKEAGAGKVYVFDLDDVDEGVKRIRSASIVWIGGGGQTRLVEALRDTPVPGALRERLRQGGIIAGTSAGAAALSKVMITGDADLESVRGGTTKTVEGLALWPEVVVDQHFLRRRRFNRLLSLIVDRPKLVGVGIDESTAVVARGTRFEVIGKGSVVVLDARKAKTRARPGKPSSATDVRLHLLTAGMTFDLAEGR